LLNQAPVSGESTEQQMLVSVNLEESNYNWAMDQIGQRNWPNLSVMVNFALRTLRSATQEKGKSKSKAATPPAETTSPVPLQTGATKEDKNEEKKPPAEKEEAESKEDKTSEKAPSAAEPAKPKPAKKFVRKPIKKPPQTPASKPRRNPLS
jgi:Arc/MetJ-type ribon-helix-helix transcriptional regulator